MFTTRVVVVIVYFRFTGYASSLVLPIFNENKFSGALGVDMNLFLTFFDLSTFTEHRDTYVILFDKNDLRTFAHALLPRPALVRIPSYSPTSGCIRTWSLFVGVFSK